jgi:hypothetical protein
MTAVGKYWTQERDVMLLRAEAEGLTRIDIARLLGTTKNAVIGRLNRLHKIPNEALAARQSQKRVAEAKILSDLENKLKAGLDPRHAALRAYAAGASWPAILRNISSHK